MNISGRDAKVFFVSLLLAYGIWLIHNLSLNYSEVVRIPLQAQCDINGHAWQSANSTIVIARCQARGFNLMRLSRAERRKPVTIMFNTSDMHLRGEEFYYVTADDLRKYADKLFGGGTKLESLVSDTLMFRFPYENHKRVAVQPVYSLSFAPQYVNVGDLKLNPDSVTVYGEPVHLESIDRVYTEAFNLDNLKSSVHGEIKLDRLEGVRLSNTSVDYSMTVTRFVEFEKTLSVDIRNVPRGKQLIVYPSTVNVRFRCHFPMVTSLPDNLTVYVDYADFASSLEGQCIPHIDNLPAGVISCSIRPKVLDCVESGR